MVPVFLIVPALVVGGGDFLATHGESLEASAAIGIGCGLIVVVLAWLGKGASGAD